MNEWLPGSLLRTLPKYQVSRCSVLRLTPPLTTYQFELTFMGCVNEGTR